ncbi:EAL domain-containing protein [Lysinibacillus yapensis]|uniref:EAL domain-containing protein n=1 Tax=Ureibacillus yapensis TaxID=2304605 RepID=A0A396S5E9_9BACL|nr:EAL domain-containing protein [Lysinibacillus yapensis]RHW34715.1 EAL domain-containing protein [Lysinibacillus yapensis]
MDICNACFSGNLDYSIKFEGEKNWSFLPILVVYLKKRNHLIHYKNTMVEVKEEAIVELVGFFKENLDCEAIFFSVDRVNWKPIHLISQTYEARWVDDILVKNSAFNYIQPIVDGSENVYGYEMLARFHDGNGGVLSPFEVFNAAKLRSRTFSLDRLCRLTAVKSAAFVSGKVFINFIPTAIYSPEHCLQSTVQLANELNIEPSRFVFEVVETEEVEDLAHLKKILMYYKEKGFEYALDDVGEGFSTAEALKQLEPHFMKLDMKYVQGVSMDERKQAVAKDFLNTALRVGAVPLAEGIEKREDFIWLKNEGYKLFQGYYFGKPSPIHTLETRRKIEEI